MLSSELKAFYMVARLGSITLAAKKLGLSQPTVTTQIRSLESHYGVELFYRGGRRGRTVRRRSGFPGCGSAW